MSIRLCTVSLIVSENSQKVQLNVVPLSDILMGTAIVYDENNVTVWHDSVRIERENNAAYAVFDEPVAGRAMLSYLVE